MSRNEINLDQIQRRLGSSKPAQRQYDDYDPQKASNPFDELQSEGSTINAAFIATAVAAFLAIGSGTYFYIGEGLPLQAFSFNESPENFVSAVDPVCKPLWKAGTSNDAALKCYLTVNTKRLCDSNEKSHLAQIIVQYRKESNLYHSGLDSKASKEAFSGMARNLGFASEVAGTMARARAAKGEDGELTADGKKRLKADTDRLRKKIEIDPETGALPPGMKLRPDAKMKKSKADDESRDAEAGHASKLKLLAEQGYLGEGDFGWSPDRMVRKAFSKAKPKTSDPCQL